MYAWLVGMVQGNPEAREELDMKLEEPLVSPVVDRRRRRALARAVEQDGERVLLESDPGELDDFRAVMATSGDQ